MLKIASLLVFFISPSYAQQETALSTSMGSNTAEDLRLKQNSQLFSVTVVPGSKETEFRIAGKKAGDFRRDKIRLRGTYNMNGKETPISITRQKDRFITTDPVRGREMTIEITDEETGKTERVKAK